MLKKIINLNSLFNFTICHRIPERSFFFRGKQFPLCSRCTGIVIGYWLYPFLIFDIISIPLIILIAMHIPMVIDGMTQLFFNRESTNKLRFITGFMAGISQVGLIDFLASFFAHLIYEIYLIFN